jgi:hypothetical protein
VDSSVNIFFSILSLSLFHSSFPFFSILLHSIGVDLLFVGHQHHYSRDPPLKILTNGTVVVDMPSVSPNIGNETNPVQVYTNPMYMSTIVTAAPGDQEVNRRQLHSHERATAPETSLTSSRNYGYSILTICNETTLHARFETAVPVVNSTNVCKRNIF